MFARQHEACSAGSLGRMELDPDALAPNVAPFPEGMIGCPAMFSDRFQKPIIVTDHARNRMIDRDISDVLLLDMIETGDIRYSDKTRLWIAKRFAERDDNLLCAAVALETALVVKTVMHHFSWESGL